MDISCGPSDHQAPMQIKWFGDAKALPQSFNLCP